MAITNHERVGKALELPKSGQRGHSSRTFDARQKLTT
jgi:hypothetical protein